MVDIVSSDSPSKSYTICWWDVLCVMCIVSVWDSDSPQSPILFRLGQYMHNKTTEEL
jgi:hypothetical protein